jgi:hypothetical protein
MLAALFIEAGGPAGLFNVVHGDKLAVDAILDHPRIKAVSFVGSSDIANYVYQRGAQAGKRMQCMGGAKNHGIVLPDADFDQVVSDILGAAYGSAGERCMALPVVVPVGDKTAEELRARLVDGIAGLKVGISTDPAAHYGPVVTAQHKARIESYIQMGVDEGAELVVDGRGFSLQGYENGNFLAPTLFDRVTRRCAATRTKSSAPCSRSCARRMSTKRSRWPPTMPMAMAWPCSPATARRAQLCRQGGSGHGRHQRADPGAGRLSQLWRVEALGLWRSQPIRHGRRALLHPHQDRDPALAQHVGRRGGPELRHPDDEVNGKGPIAKWLWGLFMINNDIGTGQSASCRRAPDRPSDAPNRCGGTTNLKGCRARVPAFPFR